MKLFKPKVPSYYLDHMHLYIDDLKELTELREQCKLRPDSLEEQLFYSRLINGAQRVLEYMQQETTR